MMKRLSAIILLLVLSGCSLLNPKPTYYSTENYFKQGEELLARGKYKDAAKAWEKSLKLMSPPR